MLKKIKNFFITIFKKSNDTNHSDLYKEIDIAPMPKVPDPPKSWIKPSKCPEMPSIVPPRDVCYLCGGTKEEISDKFFCEIKICDECVDKHKSEIYSEKLHDASMDVLYGLEEVAELKSVIENYKKKLETLAKEHIDKFLERRINEKLK